LKTLKDVTKYVHQLFFVDFVSDSATGTVETKRRPVGHEEFANAVSSEVAAFPYEPFDNPTGPTQAPPGWHTIAIDVDHDAALVPSTTLGHYHLYVDIPPVKWEAYERWLIASADIGLIEPGYLRASQERKATFLRLPWVLKKKGDR
jgi:hypothetical protein